MARRALPGIAAEIQRRYRVLARHRRSAALSPTSCHDRRDWRRRLAKAGSSASGSGSWPSATRKSPRSYAHRGHGQNAFLRAFGKNKQSRHLPYAQHRPGFPGKFGFFAFAQNPNLASDAVLHPWCLTALHIVKHGASPIPATYCTVPQRTERHSVLAVPPAAGTIDPAIWSNQKNG